MEIIFLQGQSSKLIYFFLISEIYIQLVILRRNSKSCGLTYMKMFLYQIGFVTFNVILSKAKSSQIKILLKYIIEKLGLGA